MGKKVSKLSVKQVKVVYFYPLLIGNIDEEKAKKNGFDFYASDLSDPDFEDPAVFTPPFVYFKHKFVKKREDASQLGLSQLRNKKVEIKLREPIKWKNGSIDKFPVALKDIVVQFIGLENGQAIFWLELNLELSYKEDGELFAQLSALTLLGDNPKSQPRGNKGFIIYEIAIRKIEECRKSFKERNLVEEAYKNCVEQDMNPYVLVTVRITDKEGAVKEFLNRYNRNIVSVLLRSRKISAADEDFISKYCVSRDKELANMCARKDLFINVHERVAVAICTGETQKYIAELIKSLAYLRALWYSYVVADFLLSYKISDMLKNIEKTRNQYGESGQKKTAIYQAVLGQTMEHIIELSTLKAFGLRFLDEVITYKIQRGSLKGIVEELTDYFKVSTIKENLKFKLQQIDTLLDYFLEIQGRIMASDIAVRAKRLEQQKESSPEKKNK